MVDTSYSASVKDVVIIERSVEVPVTVVVAPVATTSSLMVYLFFEGPDRRPGWIGDPSGLIDLRWNSWTSV
jgi:hypothetical protein